MSCDHDAGDPTPFTGRDLAAMPEGARLKDATGDVWEKRNGWWVCLDARLRGEALLTIWGPVTSTEEPAKIWRSKEDGE